MSDKRKFARIHLVHYLLVFDDTTDTLVGHVVDISQGGMKLMTRMPLTIGTLTRFRMLLPNETLHESRQLLFDGHTAWSQQNLYSDFYGAGIHFSSIAQSDIDIIKSLIEQFGYQQETEPPAP